MYVCACVGGCVCVCGGGDDDDDYNYMCTILRFLTKKHGCKLHGLDHVFFYLINSSHISSQTHCINSEQKLIDNENPWWNVHVQSYYMSTRLMVSPNVENVSWNNYNKQVFKDVLNFRLRALVSTHWLGSEQKISCSVYYNWRETNCPLITN